MNELISVLTAINEMKGKDAEMRKLGLNEDEITLINDFDLENYPPLKKVIDLINRMENIGKKN